MDLFTTEKATRIEIPGNNEYEMLIREVINNVENGTSIPSLSLESSVKAMSIAEKIVERIEKQNNSLGDFASQNPFQGCSCQNVLTHPNQRGLVRTFYEAIKSGTQERAISRKDSTTRICYCFLWTYINIRLIRMS